MMELDFPQALTGMQEKPLDMQVFLFRGASAIHRRDVQRLLRSKKFGPMRRKRLRLVRQFHELLKAPFVAGGTKDTLVTTFAGLRSLYRHADAIDIDPERSNVIDVFMSWSSVLHQRVLTGTLKGNAAYAQAVSVAKVLAQVFNLQSARHLLSKARWRKVAEPKRPHGPKAEKQNLEKMQRFCSALVDICDSLTTEAMRASLPIVIEFRDGQRHEEWCRLRPAHTVKLINSGRLKAREARCNNDAPAVRATVVNLRIQAELARFIALSSMNPTQAKNIRLGDFRYESSQEGYLVRRYKDRKKGEVEFSICSVYRPFFERYLLWRKDWIAESEKLLFPSIASANRSASAKPHFQRLKYVLRRVKVAFIPPRTLRETNVNWLLRQGRDPEIVAEIAQHSLSTLQHSYQRPHHQIAVTEITRFFKEFDPKKIETPGPTSCSKLAPAPEAEKPGLAPDPDCKNGAGCLFCQRHRDRESFDYCWNLASYRYLRSLELARHTVRATESPVLAVIERLSAKLEAIGALRPEAADWVREALDRAPAGNHHPKWKALVAFSEAL